MATKAQIALAWVLAQNLNYVPIPGTTKLHRLKENIAASEIVFSADELAELNEASAKVKIMGDRYTDEQEAATGL